MNSLRHRPKVAVAAWFAVTFAVGLLATRFEIDPFITGTTAQVLGGFAIFITINQYLAALYSVPRVRKQRGRDTSFQMALAYAGAAPALGMVAVVATGLYWPFWTCVALGLVGTVGPLSVLSMVGGDDGSNSL